MKRAEIIEMLNSTGLPVTYFQWQVGQVPPLPYLVYYYPIMTPETADGKNHASVYQFNVELYTKNKSFETEDLVEAAFTDKGITFTKDESYINDEHMYEVLYITEVIIDG